MSLNFTELRAFHAVAEAGSVGGGAARLLVSQPAVSKQIKQLERALETTLFERTPRGVRLTQAGELLAGYTLRIFALADEAEQSIDDLAGMRRGKLALAASPTLGTHFLPEVLVRFRRRFPAIALSLEIENAAVMQRRLSEGALDAGFSEVSPSGSEIEAEVFMHDRLIAVARPGHPLARARTLTLRKLADEPFIVRETGSMTKSMVERALAARGLTIKPALSVGSTEAVKYAVAAGMGVAIISALSAEPELASRRLVKLPVRDLSLTRPLYCLRPRARHPSKALHAFLCLIRHARGFSQTAARPARSA